MDTNEDGGRGRLAEAKALASRLMHLHYCEGDAAAMAGYFAPQFTWFGAGEEQYAAGREAAEEKFRQFKGAIPECVIWDEEYDAIEPAPGVYVVSGRLWIATAPGVQMYLKAHQRVTFVFQESENGLLCAHIHCSNPYQELVGEEMFPEKIGRQSYDFVQERLEALEAQAAQQNRQLEVIMSSIAGGLKISRDDERYSFKYVSEEAAALFGYTVEEFMAVTGGTALGAVYPPDRERVLGECSEAFRDGGLSYSIRYRIRCRDGSLKWIIDSGKKTLDTEGSWMVNSLYLDVTRAEEDAQRLREQTQLLSSIYDTVPCGIIRFVRRKDGRHDLVSMNKSALAPLGYASLREGLDDWRDGATGSVIPEDQEELRRTYEELREVGDRQDREYRALWPDGSLHWLEGANMIVDRTPEGEDVIQRTLIDITRRKELQQQLEREQEMYRVAMEASSDVMFEYLMDADTFVSYEPCPGQGVIRRELQNYAERIMNGRIVHPEDARTAVDNIINGREEEFEVRIFTPDAGEYRWHRVNSRVIPANGRPGRVVGTIRNIHTLKKTLSESSERLHMNQSALQAISGMYVSIFYVNLTDDSYYAVRLPRAGDVMSFPRAGSYSGDLCAALLPCVEKSDRESVAGICDRERLLKYFNVCGNTETEFQQNMPGGAEGPWLRLEVYPLSAETADTKTAIVTLRNVSAEKRQELKRRAEDKAAKQALEEAYEGARRANLAKSEFLSRMSHDIRTPMNAILGMTAIAERQLDDRERLKDCLAKIRVSGDHLLGLINEVLDMSKIESGNAGLNESAFFISDVLEAAAEMIRPEAGRKGQSFTLRTEVVHNAVYGDAMRLQQILLNLLSNAVKYTGEGGGVTLAVNERISGHGGVGCFELVVEDNGIGIPPEFIGKLFTPFERADDPRVSRVHGTGLGLAITHNLVQMMNGGIKVESRINEGTRFIATIFMKLSEKPAEVSRPRPAEPEEPAAFAPGTKILLVEDNDINREIAEELLGMAGLETASAADGREAVALFSKNPPGTYALILMDIQMPVMNGYEAARAIRGMGDERPDAAAIPIIALTANAFADDALEARRAGMNEHVSKPLDLNKLINTMHHWLDTPEG